MKQSITTKIKSAPKESGVYIFYQNKKPLYVGKAANLRNRLKSYLPAVRHGLKITDPKTQSLNNEADKLEYIILHSEIEALIEESQLIQELKPKYNVLWMDNKSYHYVAFIKEKFPKIFITHRNLKPKNYKLKASFIGPFTDGAALRLVIKTIRRYFSYCTCLRPHFRDCLNAQIGRCFGYCCKKNAPSDKIAALPSIARNDRKTYAKNIRAIKMILRGQGKKLLKNLKNKKEREALYNIFQHKPYIDNSTLVEGRLVLRNIPQPHRAGSEQSEADEAREKKNLPLEQIYSGSVNQLPEGTKVECYDISNLAGKEAVGVLTALKKINGSWLPDKNAYRKFKINSAPLRDDPRMISEILTRRLNHPEWPYPYLIIIDGGLTQFRVAKKAINLKPNIHNLKVISFAKPQKLVYGLKPKDGPTPISQLPKELQELIERAIYQTHNFAIRYHRQVRNVGFFR